MNTFDEDDLMNWEIGNQLVDELEELFEENPAEIMATLTCAMILTENRYKHLNNQRDIEKFIEFVNEVFRIGFAQATSVIQRRAN